MSNNFKKGANILLAPEFSAQIGLWSDGDSHRIVGVNVKYMGRDAVVCSSQYTESRSSNERGVEAKCPENTNGRSVKVCKVLRNE